MAEIPGAKAELERLGRLMRAQMLDLVARLTPEAEVFPQKLGHPSVADWHEPLRFTYGMTSRGARPDTVPPAEMAQRAAEVLATAGWAVAVEEEVADAYCVTGRSEDVMIRVRVSTVSDVMLYIAETPKMALATPEPFTRPEPLRTVDTLSPGHVLCYECDGLGWCRCCYGRGWIPDSERGRRRCRECHQGRACPICRGAGEKYAADLQDDERGQYPELVLPPTPLLRQE
ncbi:hypothetical protein [Nonomuraea dietziae]|uniref:hypothetical protein n=1 Tax=Nonomuraea dietziae TaxID=65515 RepID=UPI0033E7D488